MSAKKGTNKANARKAGKKKEKYIWTKEKKEKKRKKKPVQNRCERCKKPISRKNLINGWCQRCGRRFRNQMAAKK